MRRARPFAVLVLLVAGACGGGAGGPEAAVEAMLRAFDAGDCAAVKEVVLAPSEVDCGFVTELSGMFADEGVDLDEVELSVADATDDQATVAIDWADGEPEETYEVQRVDGAWKVLLDSAA